MSKAVFTKAELLQISEVLSVPCDERFASQVEDVARICREFTEYWETKKSKTDLTDDLKKVKKQADKLIDSLESLDPSARIAILLSEEAYGGTIQKIKK